MAAKLSLRAGETNIRQGAWHRLDFISHPKRILVNLGNNRVAQARIGDLGNPEIKDIIAKRKILVTYDLNEIIINTSLRNRLLNSEWLTEKVHRDQLDYARMRKADNKADPRVEELAHTPDPELVDTIVEPTDGILCEDMMGRPGDWPKEDS